MLAVATHIALSIVLLSIVCAYRHGDIKCGMTDSCHNAQQLPLYMVCRMRIQRTCNDMAQSHLACLASLSQ